MSDPLPDAARSSDATAGSAVTRQSCCVLLCPVDGCRHTTSRVVGQTAKAANFILKWAEPTGGHLGQEETTEKHPLQSSAQRKQKTGKKSGDQQSFESSTRTAPASSPRDNPNNPANGIQTMRKKLVPQVPASSSAGFTESHETH